MKYQVSLEIQRPVTQVAESYINNASMKKWEAGLIQIIETKGCLFESKSEGILVFEYDGQRIEMKTKVESNMLPHQIVMIYEMMGTWNRCINHFIDRGNSTIWEMEVEFQFDKPTSIRKEQFIEKTTQGMHLFKNYVEGI